MSSDRIDPSSSVSGCATPAAERASHSTSSASVSAAPHRRCPAGERAHRGAGLTHRRARRHTRMHPRRAARADLSHPPRRARARAGPRPEDLVTPGWVLATSKPVRRSLTACSSISPRCGPVRVDRCCRRRRAPRRRPAANVALRKEMRERDNHYPEIEAAAAPAVAAAGYPGYGPLSERMLLDLVAHLGFTVDRVPRLVRSTRSITDRRNRVIYIPAARRASTRAARSVVLSTIGHFVLGHPIRPASPTTSASESSPTTSPARSSLRKPPPSPSSRPPR